MIMVAGIVYAFLGGWYWAVIGIVVGFALGGANEQSVLQFIAATAAKNPAFKAEMEKAGVIADD